MTSTLVISLEPNIEELMPNVLMAARKNLSRKLYTTLTSSWSIVQVFTQIEAIRVLESEHFDLIVCGTQFDDGDLFQFIRRVRKNERSKSTPIVCIRYLESSLADSLQESVSQALKIAGASAFLDANHMDAVELGQLMDNLVARTTLK